MFYKLKKTYAMVRVFTYHAAIAAALLPLAFGCKRENPNELGTNTTMATPETSKVQQWLKGQPQSQGTTSRKARTTLPNLTLQWQGAKFDAATATHWVPATNKKEAGGQPNTYLVATENKLGQITGGQYVMVLPNAKKMGKDNTGYGPIAMLAEKKPTNFSGALLYYDVQGQLTGSSVYEAGQLQPKATANIAARDAADADPDPNYVVQECGNATGANPCIEWYWQTYVNGVLVSEDYINTTCCGGTSGGGSGGTAPPAITSCERTQSQAEAILEGITLTNTNIITMQDGRPYGTNANEPIRKPKQVRWEFLKLRQYLEFYVQFAMVYNGVVYKNNAADPAWKWESLAVGNLERTGTIAPCFDVSLTYNVVDPVISADKRAASSSISYVAIATVPCLGNPQVGSYPGNHSSATFYAN